MTVKELSEYLRLDRMTIYKMLKDGSIPASRIGHQWRFFRDDIDVWIRSLRTGQRTALLVVGGDPKVGLLFEEDLPSDTYEVVVVPTGDEAMALVSNRDFDMVFLDLKKATLQVFKQIRAKDGAVPVIVSITTPDSKLMDQAMEVGSFTMVKKPKSKADLESILNTLPVRSGASSN